MFLVQLVYVSKAQTNLNERDIEEILTLSKMNNERQAITGLLSFNHSYFLQCLEGSRSTVNDTYQKILKGVLGIFRLKKT